MEGSSSARAVLWMVAVAMAVSSSMVAVNGQGACISDLSICLTAISNSSVKPSSDCCNSLKKAVKNDLACLCKLYSNVAFFQTANLNRTRAFEIPRLCSINDNFSQCLSAPAGASPASSSAPAPPATASTPPPASSGSDCRHGALRLRWIIKLYWALGLLCASVVIAL